MILNILPDNPVGNNPDSPPISGGGGGSSATPPADPSADIGFWTQYFYPTAPFSGAFFLGTPVITHNIGVIDHNSANGTLPTTLSSQKWIGRFNFTTGGVYQFDFATDDGMIVSIDGVQVMREWRDQEIPSSYFTYRMTAGIHNLEVLHYNKRNTPAYARLHWTNVNPDTPPHITPPPPTPIPAAPQVTVTDRADIHFSTQLVMATKPIPVSVKTLIELDVSPAIPNFGSQKLNKSVNALVESLPIDLKSAIKSEIGGLISGVISTFFDVDRELKTLLNFGSDRQELITNWKPDGTDAVVVKLHRPLSSVYGEQDELWISREISFPIIDRILVQANIVADVPLYLRPANRNVEVSGLSSGVSNVTLASLLPSSSIASSSLQPIDLVLSKFYSTDAGGVELNIDYSDYRNFVHFSSAKARLKAFTTKLTLIESLNSRIVSWSIAFAGVAGSAISGSQTYGYIQKIGDQKNELMRSFDGYERFMYFQTGSAYSSSVTPFDTDTIYYNSDSTWPQVSGSVLSVTSSVAQTWLAIQTNIAAIYDNLNQNRLVNNLPLYVVEDAASRDFITFVDMTGHHFDIIKPYIDHMTDIYDRHSSSKIGLSNDLTWNIANSLGIDLPNKYAIKNLVDYTIGQVGDKVYSQVVSETWKRFLHNQIHLAKTKGTKTSIKGLMNAYGILPSLVKIKEYGTPATLSPTSSYETYEETTNALALTGVNYIAIPWSASLLPMKTVEIGFATSTPQTADVFNVGSSWAMGTVPVSGSYGYLELRNSATGFTTVSSSIFPLFDGKYQFAMVRYNDAGIELKVRRMSSDVVDFASDSQEPIATITGIWQNVTGSNLYLGGSGSLFGTPFVGTVDEFRLWGETISDSTFDLHSKYPGMYSGNATDSAQQYLYARLSFNTPKNLGATPFVVNETPRAKSGIMAQFTASGFASASTFPYSMTSITREALVYTPNAGGVQVTNNKIIIADPPRVTLNSSGLPQLYPKQSIVPLSQKDVLLKGNNTVGIYFSLTDSINDSIVRSMGTIDLQSLLGDPADQFADKYSALTALSTFYWQNYAYNYNLNTFISFTESLLSPFFKQVKEFVPIRTKLVTGIVIEPNILERSKVSWKPTTTTLPYPNMDGSMLREVTIKDRVSPDVTGSYFYPTVLLKANNTTSASVQYQPLSASLSTTGTTKVSAPYARYTASLVTKASPNPIALLASYSSSVSLINKTANFTSEVDTQYATYNIHDYYQYAVKISGPLVLNLSSLYAIQPTSDFSDIGARNYFYQPYGIVNTVGYIQLRELAGVIRSRGTWTAGTFYSLNDYVLQAGVTSSAALSGNGNEFRCISNASFVSYTPPAADTVNWRPVKYTPVTIDIKKLATQFNPSSSISLVPTGSNFTPFVGYAPNHYRFSRDLHTTTMRLKYYGSKLTDATTIDGKPVVEITATSADRLFVTDNSIPVQKASDTSGPILEVK